MKLKDYLPGKMVGNYVNRIKRGNLEKHCALSLLGDVVCNEQDSLLPDTDEFWNDFVPKLIDSYEKNHDWNDVLKFVLNR